MYSPIEDKTGFKVQERFRRKMSFPGTSTHFDTLKREHMNEHMNKNEKKKEAKRRERNLKGEPKQRRRRRTIT